MSCIAAVGQPASSAGQPSDDADSARLTEPTERCGDCGPPSRVPDIGAAAQAADSVHGMFRSHESSESAEAPEAINSAAVSQEQHSDSAAINAQATNLVPLQSQDVRPAETATDTAADGATAEPTSIREQLQAGQPSDSGPAADKSEASPATNISTANPDVGASEGPAAVGRTKPVMLILCGVPGSGKSTFCAGLQASGSATWVR